MNRPVLASAVLICGVLWSGAIGQSQDTQHVNGKHAKEFERRLKKAHAQAAGFHRTLARWLSRQGMDEWAHKQWKVAIELDPASVDKMPDQELWNNRPKGDLAQIWSDLEARLSGDGSTKIGAAYAGLAQWAMSMELTEEAVRAWTRALEYDGRIEKARQALGHAKVRDRWLSKGQQRVEETLLKAGEGISPEDVAGKTPAEKVLGRSLLKSRATHVFVQCDVLSKKELLECVRVGEQTHIAFCELFGAPPGAKAFVARHIVVKDQKGYAALIDALQKHSGFNKETQKRQRAAWLATDSNLMNGEGALPSFIQEGVVHFTAEMALVLHGSALRPWFFEGTGFLLAERVVGTVGWHCSGGTKTTIGREFGGSFDWRASTKACVRAGVDPAPHEFLRAEWNDLNTERSLKIWSYIDFMVSEKPEEVKKLVLALRKEPKTSEEDEAIIKEVFGMTVAELDAAWRSWVLRTY